MTDDNNNIRPFPPKKSRRLNMSRSAIASRKSRAKAKKENPAESEQLNGDRDISRDMSLTAPAAVVMTQDLADMSPVITDIAMSPASPVAAPTARHGASMTLAAALAIAAVQGRMAVFGQTSVFAGAFWTVLAMGVALEFAKLAAVAWLGRGHGALPLRMVVIALVAIMMGLGSIGTFGFLSSARLARVTADRAVVNQHAAEVESRAKVQQASLADIDRRINQLDQAIDTAIKRRPASGMALSDQLKHTRADLLVERNRAGLVQAGIEIEDARIRSDREQLAADSGPVVYLSAFLGADPDFLMRCFILAVSVLLDPLACVLLLAAQARQGPIAAALDLLSGEDRPR